jgi:superfamily I DNA and/or RNA helicase
LVTKASAHATKRVLHGGGGAQASQSDVTALSALLRGKHVLVVGDQKQVSPTAAFVSESRIRDLKQSLLASRHPYVEQLLPGRSIFDLAQTCFADARVALSQHFRCVPQCIAFSNEQVRIISIVIGKPGRPRSGR